ncbi:HNH endonuclease signature motif containing protein [uncultured Sulfitobacter sp.]|uniref:HNH endonuclease n=1 Tax=uncultured Sulfitobacter sp. TaxID=191468 RepID=UPI002621ACA1|nr:HNH endonuclease signature motif containing protein [uncultured Sulfitobacter sp.]
MANAITLAQVRSCYAAARDVFHSKRGLSQAKDQAIEKSGIGASSALRYIDSIVGMLRAEQYASTMKISDTAALLEWIGRDYGVDARRGAAKAVLEHVDYYAALSNGGPQKAIRRIAEEVLTQTALPEISPLAAQEEDDKFLLAVSRALGDDAGRKARLATAPARPRPVMRITRTYRRNPDVVAEALYKARGMCGDCKGEAPFLRKDGTPFLEVHHILPLGDGGLDAVENVIALCPNCHRRAHFGIAGAGLLP